MLEPAQPDDLPDPLQAEALDAVEAYEEEEGELPPIGRDADAPIARPERFSLFRRRQPERSTTH
ncbi:hypothetical protein DN585_05400 [Intrasporangium calvum]|nr:hypothetical protein DN585_05400 [Intrasporangium calvum]